ncbi:MAG TPA: nickel insertion protein, partial [Polyangia bacterium]|nr:nickel insertion protein [Polyangia bacterium]
MSELPGAELYFDCFAGIAGDMTLGALLDLGVPEEVVRAELAKLPLANYRLTRERVQRGALMGTKIHVLIDDAPAHDDRAHDHDHNDDHGHHHDAHAHGHHHDDGAPAPHHHVGAHLHDAPEPRSHHHHAEQAAAPPHDPRHSHAPNTNAHSHTHYRDIRAMLERHLGGDTLVRALAIFDRIAVVEAR